MKNTKFTKGLVTATMATLLVAPQVLGVVPIQGSLLNPVTAHADNNLSASFTWDKEADKWTHGEISTAKTVILGNAKVGIYSQDDNFVTVASGEARYDNSYMASPMATIPVVAGTTQYATIDLAESDMGGGISGQVTVAVTFASIETPDPVKPQSPTNVTFNDEGDYVTAWVGANTSTSVYDANGNKIDDGSMYMQTEGRARLDLVRRLTKGEQIYVLSLNPDNHVESDKTWATFMPESSKTALTVMGMDRDSGETLWSTVKELDSDQTHTLTADAIEGYTLVSAPSEDVYVTGDSMTHTFLYKKDPVAPVEKFSAVTIQYVDNETGTPIVPENVVHDVKVGTDYVGNAIKIDGYKIVGENTQTIKVGEDASSNVLSFKYAKEAPTVEKANVTVKYVDENGKELGSAKVIKDLEVGTEVTEKAFTIEGYDLTSESEKTVTVARGGSEITFTYKAKEVTPPVVEKGNLTVKYVDEKGKDIATPKVVKDLQVGKSQVERAVKVKGYDLVGTDTEEKEIKIEKGENTMTFTYKEVKEEVAIAENIDFISGSNGKQMTAFIPKGLTMYVVYKGEVIGKAQNQISLLRSTFMDFDPTIKPTTINLTKEVAVGDTVQYYTENADGEKSVTLELTRAEDPTDTTEPTKPVEPTEPEEPTEPTKPSEETDNGKETTDSKEETKETDSKETTTDSKEETKETDSKETTTSEKEKEKEEDAKLKQSGKVGLGIVGAVASMLAGLGAVFVSKSKKEEK